MHLDNFNKYKELRKRHPDFIYESYDLSIDNDRINIVFTFSLDEKALFKPALNIPVRDFFVSENMTVEKLKSFAFHIGMIELVSYWKASCSPRIIIRPHKLDEWQVGWWKKLYFLGLGEFFYRNGIHNSITDFVEIISYGETVAQPVELTTNQSVLVPLGGGKDSTLTLELLKSTLTVYPVCMNPRQAVWDTVTNAGIAKEKLVVLNRKLDNKLLQLNKEGYLNGHTPFSALVAFVTGLTAALTGSADIALANESSANESTILDTQINHQYSKSFEFEQDFRTYFSKYLSASINYFSFLRPWNELQIVKAFAKYPGHHHSFRSCNIGSKNDTWCGSCSKCLFTFIMLSAFLSQEKVSGIFGKNLFEDESLIPVLDELIGKAPEKPFECVGTVDEVNIALVEAISKIDDIPALLHYYKGTEQYNLFKNVRIDILLDNYDDKNNLSEAYINILLKDN